jgi:hypothetical protein
VGFGRFESRRAKTLFPFLGPVSEAPSYATGMNAEMTQGCSTSLAVSAGRPSFGGQLTKVRTPGYFGSLLHPRGSTAASTNGQFKLRRVNTNCT